MSNKTNKTKRRILPTSPEEVSVIYRRYRKANTLYRATIMKNYGYSSRTNFEKALKERSNNVGTA